MKILIAGATGAIGRPLIDRMKQSGHTVFAMVRAQRPAGSLEEKGVEPITGNGLDSGSVKAAVARVAPDAVINELTSLPRHYTPAEMQAAAERDRKVRIDGNKNLLAAIRHAGVRRYVLQSSGFWYAPGAGLADESAQFALDASPGVAASARTYAELEATALRDAVTECVILRYGFFYGPGTWYTKEGDLGEQVRARQLAVIGEGQGVYSFVHIEDAAAATAAALQSAPGIYNVVDDSPSPQRVWLPAFARAAGAPPPPHVTEQEALATIGADAVYYATRLRGASNEKAKRALHFSPRPLEWLGSGQMPER
jgi:nucleoside-diphosphate-sugar epimerase